MGQGGGMKCAALEANLCRLRVVPCWSCPRRDPAYTGVDRYTPTQRRARAEARARKRAEGGE